MVNVDPTVDSHGGGDHPDENVEEVGKCHSQHTKLGGGYGSDGEEDAVYVSDLDETVDTNHAVDHCGSWLSTNGKKNSKADDQNKNNPKNSEPIEQMVLKIKDFVWTCFCE